MKGLKRQLPPRPACVILYLCLDAQASAAGRTGIRQQPAWLPSRRVSLFPSLSEKGRRIRLPSRSANWAEAKEARFGLNGFPQSVDARLPKRPQQPDGEWSEGRFSLSFAQPLLLIILSMPARTATANRRVQGDGLLAPKISKKKIALPKQK